MDPRPSKPPAPSPKQPPPLQPPPPPSRRVLQRSPSLANAGGDAPADGAAPSAQSGPSWMAGVHLNPRRRTSDADADAPPPPPPPPPQGPPPPPPPPPPPAPQQSPSPLRGPHAPKVRKPRKENPNPQPKPPAKTKGRKPHARGDASGAASLPPSAHGPLSAAAPASSPAAVAAAAAAAVQSSAAALAGPLGASAGIPGTGGLLPGDSHGGHVPFSSYSAKDKRRKPVHPANYVPHWFHPRLGDDIVCMLYVFGDLHGVEDACARVVEEALRTYVAAIGGAALRHDPCTPSHVLQLLLHSPELMVKLRSLGLRDAWRSGSAASAAQVATPPPKTIAQLPMSADGLIAPRFGWMNDYQFVVDEPGAEPAAPPAAAAPIDPWHALGISGDRTVGLTREEFKRFRDALQAVLQFRRSVRFAEWLATLLERQPPADVQDILGIVFVERVREITLEATRVRAEIAGRTVRRMDVEDALSSEASVRVSVESRVRRSPLNPVHFMEALRRLPQPYSSSMTCV